MSKRVTSTDVAARAGVSQSAVSRVFSGASASQSVKDKVQKAAAELGYRPNVLARSLITGRSKIIGLVVAYLDNQFYPDALQRLSSALQDQGYHILIFTAFNTGEDVDRVMSDLLDYQVDGIILASVSISNALAERCADRGLPVVLFNRGQDGADVNEVTSDNLAGGREVADFLARGPHQRIAMIRGWPGSSTGRDREVGFREGLKAHGLDPVAVLDGDYAQAKAAKAARDLFAPGGPKPDAIFVGNDHMAFAVMDVLRHEMQLDVPGDVSVVGYDDVPMAAWAAYDLTTVRQPSGRMVEATVETLMKRIADPGLKSEKIRIQGPLILRGSAKLPGGSDARF